MKLTHKTSSCPHITDDISIFNKLCSCRCREIQANLTATAVKNIPDSLRELAQQNRVMKRELLLHRESIYDTEQEIEQLKEDIRFDIVLMVYTNSIAE